MTSAKTVILTAIKMQGIGGVLCNTKKLADDCLCSETYVKSIIRDVKTGKIVIS